MQTILTIQVVTDWAILWIQVWQVFLQLSGSKDQKKTPESFGDICSYLTDSDSGIDSFHITF